MKKKKASARDYNGYLLEVSDWYKSVDGKIGARSSAFEAGLKSRCECGWRIVAILVWQIRRCYTVSRFIR